MNCERAAAEQPGVALGAADPATTAAVRAHVARCAACAAELAAIERVTSALKRFDAPPSSAGFRARTLARVAAEAGAAASEPIENLASWRERMRRSRTARVAVAVAALFLIAVAAWLVRSSRAVSGIDPATRELVEDSRQPHAPVTLPRDRAPTPFLPRGAVPDDESLRPRPELVEAPRSPSPSDEPLSPDVLRDLAAETEQDNAVSVLINRFRPRFHPLQEATARSSADRAMLRGVKWLAEHQDDDGSWDPSRFGGQESTRVGNTALAVLAFLSNADKGVPGGVYRYSVDRAFRFLRDSQDASGTFGRVPGGEDVSLFNHSAAVLAFAEHYVLSKRKDTLYLPALQDGLLRLEDMAGQRRGRKPRDSDRITAPWVALALETARAAKISGARNLDASAREARDMVATLLPESTVGQRAAMSLKAAVDGVYSGASAPHVATMDDLLRPLSAPALREPTEVWFCALLAETLDVPERDRFRSEAAAALLSSQLEDGSFHSSFWWDPISEAGGDLYVTALAVLTLSAPHRIAR